ncbi:MAG: RNA polymerase factor sigma-54 [Flavobacteriales bacterium]|jgi:RNA polymerase sigma-54 factor|nr:RNA polymerase factor sigma-54 [Flavobacteriales bacterium]MBT3962979.1 RNA polymerase factor sigma-54 [Flavobacteriales bacterium]MBT4705600.1 RNA polymerase factor sigma-54 [Flavobacteriales bacterium]MBT4931139.1 RNA polymerase factor sigma-54 [Flavobacteriales bacterium]MBT5133453.1 RNA polymerase factor sigma-54 [Flavobacteriales bacterium]
MALKQSLQQKMLQKLSPQQIQLMKMLQLPTIALEARIKEEIEANPALDEGKEEREDEYGDLDDDQGDDLSDAEQEFDFSDYMDDDGTPSYKYEANNYSSDDEERTLPIGTVSTFHDRLLSQLSLRSLSDKHSSIAEHLVGSLDDSGYLRREVSAIVDDLAFTQGLMTSEEEIVHLLSTQIQDLDPPGIGARDLRECLLIQMRRKTMTVPVKTATIVLDKFYDEFVKKHYSKILHRLEISEDDLKDAIEEITQLNPKPGNSMNESSRPVEQIIPDFTLVNEGDEIQVLLNGRNAPELKVSKKYSEMMQEFSSIKGKPTKSQREAILFVKQKLDGARWFIDAIRQRQNTLITTMQAIVEYQKAYFLTGDETKLRPMILKDIAEKINMDISTVSRVSNSKYVQTSYGTFSLKYFFSESLTTDDGEEVSTREVKKILQELIETENKKKPWTDENLAKELKGKGYNIARRTVAKYREQLDIPVARLRKEL